MKASVNILAELNIHIYKVVEFVQSNLICFWVALKELCAADLRSVHLVVGGSVSLVFSLSSSWGHIHSRGLGFLHGICMTGWVDSTHTSHTVTAYHVYASAASFIHAEHALPVCVCVCLCFCLLLFVVSCLHLFWAPRPFTHPSAFLFPLSCPLLIKTF